jgi:hypothetical protein
MFRQRASILGILLILLLTTCGTPASKDRATQKTNETATQPAVDVGIEISRPSRTPTFTVTQTPSLPRITSSPIMTASPIAIRVTAQPGMQLHVVNSLYPPVYVVQVDPARWSQGLENKVVPNCGVYSITGGGLPRPQRLFWQDLGRFRWEIMDNDTSALAVPIRGNGLSDQEKNYLLLMGYNQPACRSDQEKLLANVMTVREAAGEIPFALFASPTPRPALAGFDCPNTLPARLRIGDEVSVITDGLWLRSEPRADESTKMRQFNRRPAEVITIIDGPVCEKYVYWKVSVRPFWDNATQGWFAEGDTREYYLIPVK